jgi:23S rRNA (guanosine2251-2'-O)-methyltransferase
MKQHLTYGIQAVRLALAAGRAERVYVQAGLGPKRLRRVAGELARATVPVTDCPAEELRRLTGTDKHQGIAAAVRGFTEREARELLPTLENPLLLVLDGIQDPRNFGSILRTADAAGVHMVVTARSRNVGVTAVVSKVASGAAEVQPLAEVANLARFLGDVAAAGIRIVGTDHAASTSLYDADLTGPLALILGAEGEGLRRLTRERCDELVGLPMRGIVESLNVGVAAGVCLYEAVRQRGQLAPMPTVR